MGRIRLCFLILCLGQLLALSGPPQARAWNLLADCCFGGNEFCCEIYARGVGEWW